MRQTVLSVVLDVQPASASSLVEGIVGLRQRLEAGTTEKYALLMDRVPALHFMSMSVFTDGDFDPVLVIEANFDGPPGPFWLQFEAALGPDLRTLLRFCKPPLDGTRALFEAVTAPQSRASLAPYLEAKTIRPAVFHTGNRGLDRDTILREGELFKATRTTLAQPLPTTPNPYRGLPAQALHGKLREALRPAFRWLDEAPPTRIAASETVSDIAWLAGFVLLVLLVLSLPGLILAPLGTAGRSVLAIVLATAVAAALLYRTRRALTGQEAPGLSSTIDTRRPLTSIGNPIGLTVAVVIVLVVYWALLTLMAAAVSGLLSGHSGRPLFHAARVAALLGVFSIPLTAMAVLVWVRWLERRDPSHDAPVLNPARMLAMVRREDRVVQNHMGSMVLVKPGMLRAVVIRLGLWGLGLLLRVTARDGYLASMRTIHFAHWALVDNGSRLLFFSNFDGTWESYLDDFIEKANQGLTLAWTNGVGFPPTRFLVMDGASHGRRFKTWARHSMPVTLLWYSAYKDFTVDQIERNARIAAGLRAATLTAAEAETWARDL